MIEDNIVNINIEGNHLPAAGGGNADEDCQNDSVTPKPKADVASDLGLVTEGDLAEGIGQQSKCDVGLQHSWEQYISTDDTQCNEC